MKECAIETECIKLEQFLKYESFVSSGGMAKDWIIGGQVKVNGETEFRRGKKLYDGDVVTVEEQEYRIRSRACSSKP